MAISQTSSQPLSAQQSNTVAILLGESSNVQELLLAGINTSAADSSVQTTVLSPFEAWSGVNGANSASTPALARIGDTLYMAVQSGSSAAPGPIQWTSSSDAGASWAAWQSLPGNLRSGEPLSLAVVNGNLHLGYLDGDGAIAITTLEAAGSNSWSTPYTIAGTNASAATLLRESAGGRQQLAVYYVASGSAATPDQLCKVSSATPQSAGFWSGVTPLTTADGQTAITASGPLAASRYQGRTWLAYQGGTGSSSATAITIASSAAVNRGSSWSLQTITDPGSRTGLGLSGNAGGLTLSYVTAANPQALTVSRFRAGDISPDSALSLLQTWFNADGAAGALAGASIDGNLDINGDGFADVLLSNPPTRKGGSRSGQGEQYAVFGGDRLGIASQVGTRADDGLKGSPLADVIYTLQGNDTVHSQGGADVILTGSGDDSIAIRDNAFLRIDGGAGFDQLLLQGEANQAYDFRLAVNKPEYFAGTKLRQIERISSIGSGANQLSFDAAVLNAINPDRLLFLTPDRKDAIALSGAFQRNSAFDARFQGALWTAFAAGAAADPHPALLYVLNPGGGSPSSAAAADWLSAQISINGSSLAASAPPSDAASSSITTASAPTTGVMTASAPLSAAAPATATVTATSTAAPMAKSARIANTDPAAGITDVDAMDSVEGMAVGNTLTAGDTMSVGDTMAADEDLPAGLNPAASADLTVSADMNASTDTAFGVNAAVRADRDVSADRAVPSEIGTGSPDLSTPDTTPVLLSTATPDAERQDAPAAPAGDSAGLVAVSAPGLAPVPQEVLSSLRFGRGLILESLRTPAAEQAARFVIRRSDSSHDQLIIYSSTAANSSSHPGRDYGPVLGLLRLPAGVSSRLVRVPLEAKAAATLGTPTFSLKVEELTDRGQPELHLLLSPEANADGERPVLSELAFEVDRQASQATITLRADTTSAHAQARQNLRFTLTSRSSADADPNEAGARSQTLELRDGRQTAFDLDDLRNDQVALQFNLALQAPDRSLALQPAEDSHKDRPLNLLHQPRFRPAADATLQVGDPNNASPSRFLLQGSLHRRGADAVEIGYLQLRPEESVTALLQDPERFRRRARTLLTSRPKQPGTLLPEEFEASRDFFIKNQRRLLLYAVEGAGLAELDSLDDQRFSLLKARESDDSEQRARFRTPGGVRVQLQVIDDRQQLDTRLAGQQGRAPVLDLSHYSDKHTLRGSLELVHNTSTAGETGAPAAHPADHDVIIRFYRCLDPHGTVLDRAGEPLLPGQRGYARAALHPENRIDTLQAAAPEAPESLSREFAITGGLFAAPTALVKTALENSDGDRHHDRHRFFAFPAANPEGIRAFAVLAANTFGFDDPFSGAISTSDVIARIQPTEVI
ncbi:MAG: hypothetical protein ACKOXO_06740 [Cyanobium sp.]